MSNVKIFDLKTGDESESAGETILCLGNFDGVHRGHRSLIEESVRQKERLHLKYRNVKTGVFTFSRPTQEFLTRTPPPFLTSPEEKRHLFRSYGADLLIEADFPSLRRLSPERFVNEILLKKCGCVLTICGFNFRFGYEGKGNPVTLMRLMNMRSVTMPSIECDGKTVSSSNIRECIKNGDIETANKMLGHEFRIKSAVIHGRGIGTKLKIPTINQKPPKGYITPKKGVYVTCCEFDGKKYMSVTDVGTHPTTGNASDTVIETHIPDFDGDLYGKEIEVCFRKFLRDEYAFENTEKLADEIQKNIADARAYFSDSQI